VSSELGLISDTSDITVNINYSTKEEPRIYIFLYILYAIKQHQNYIILVIRNDQVSIILFYMVVREGRVLYRSRRINEWSFIFNTSPNDEIDRGGGGAIYYTYL
jgi:hypothetical protein